MLKMTIVMYVMGHAAFKPYTYIVTLLCLLETLTGVFFINKKKINLEREIVHIGENAKICMHTSHLM